MTAPIEDYGVSLCPANPKFKDIQIAQTNDWAIWGKAIYSIRPH